jgi:hypothetical protein
MFTRSHAVATPLVVLHSNEVSTSGCLLAIVSCSCGWCRRLLRALLLFHLGESSIAGVVLLTSGYLPSSVVVVGPTDRLPWSPHRGLLLSQSALVSRTPSCTPVILLIQCRVPLSIAGLFSSYSIFSGTPSLPINHIVAPVSTGLLSSLLALSVVEASLLQVDVALHVDRLYCDRSRGNSLVNVG